MSIDKVLNLTNVRFGYAPDQTLINIDHFKIGHGESVFLRGPSGSGKSTLLGLIGGVLPPAAGSLSICGSDMTKISSGKRDKIRADHLGIIFQQFNLLPYIGVLQNCTLPCRFSPRRRQRAVESGGSVLAEAEGLIRGLGLTEEVFSRPVRELSVGQQQRLSLIHI